MQAILRTISIPLEWKTSTFTKRIKIKAIKLLETNKINLTTNILTLIRKC